MKHEAYSVRVPDKQIWNGPVERAALECYDAADLRGYALGHPGGDVGAIPEHFFAGAVREIHHVTCRGGVVPDLGRFVAWLARANGVEEVSKVKHSGVGLAFKGDIFRGRLETCPFGFLSMATLAHELFLHRFGPAVDRVSITFDSIFRLFGHRATQQKGE